MSTKLFLVLATSDLYKKKSFINDAVGAVSANASGHRPYELNSIKKIELQYWCPSMSQLIWQLITFGLDFNVQTFCYVDIKRIDTDESHSLVLLVLSGRMDVFGSICSLIRSVKCEVRLVPDWSQISCIMKLDSCSRVQKQAALSLLHQNNK